MKIIGEKWEIRIFKELAKQNNLDVAITTIQIGPGVDNIIPSFMGYSIDFVEVGEEVKQNKQT